MRIVVAGGGFAGLEALRILASYGDDIERILVSEYERFEYLPSVPELVSEKVKPEDISTSLKKYCEAMESDLVVGRIRWIDPEKRFLELDTGERIEYDRCLLAVGSEPNFFGIPGKELAKTSYRIEDTLDFVDSLRKAGDEAKIIVVGAGPIGVEVAGELAYLNERKGKSYEIHVVELLDKPIPAFGNERASKILLEHQRSRGILFHLGAGVSEIREGGVVLRDGGFLEGDLVLWTAGVKAPGFLSSSLPEGSLAKGYPVADEYLRLRGFEDIFLAGDCAFVKIGDKIAAKLAEEAMAQGRRAAENIIRSLRGKKLRRHRIRIPIDRPVAIVTLGDGDAILIYGRRIALRGSWIYWLDMKIRDYVLQRFSGRISSS